MAKRTKAITVYLSEEEKQILDNKAKECGLSVSDYIRLALRKTKLV